MDWTLALNRHSLALRQVIATLAAIFFNCSAIEPVRSLPRYIRIDLLRLLRPAESAARRLIVIAARGMVLPPVRPRKPGPNAYWGRNGMGRLVRRVVPLHKLPGAKPAPPRAHCFPLLDPLADPTKRRPKRARRSVPRMSQPGVFDRQPVPPKPKPNDMISALRVGQRLAALTRVLDDLPKQARRYLRWCGRRERARAENRRHRQSLMKPGTPPGWLRPRRNRTRHQVFEILDETHSLALWSIERRDSS